MRAYGVVAILFSVLFCAPAVFAAVSHESAQIRGGVFGSDFGPQDFTVNGTLDLDTLRFIGESTSVTSISALSTLGGGSASNATLPTQWAVKAYVDAAIVGSGSMSNFTIAGDTGSSVVIDGQTVTVAGGTSITTSETGRTVTVSITDDSIDGAQLADTITLDAVLAVNGQDVNFDANTLFVDVSANRVGVGTAAPGASLDVDGNLILQNGVAINEFSIDDTLAGNSDLAVPTEQAVKAYVDTAVSGLGSGSMSNFTLAGDSGSSLIVQGDTLDVAGGTGITTSAAADTVTVSITDDSIDGAQLADTITLDAPLIINTDEVRIGAGTPGVATGAGDLFVTDALEVDGSIVLGANTITGFSTATDLGAGAASNANLPTQLAVKTYVDTAVSGLGSGSMSNFTLAGDSGSSLIVQGDTLDVAGGTGITTSAAADTVTVSITDDSIDGAQLADTITLDAVLAVNGQDVNFDANTLFIDVSADSVGIGGTTLGAKLDVNGDLILQNGVAVNEFSIDDTLSGDSDLAVPTEQAVKAYVDNAVSGLGSGDVVGPGSATDNAIARFNGTTGKIIQTSGVTIDDSNNLAGIGTIDTGQGATEVYAMNQAVRTSDAVTFSTIDTGQGANELYDMNQNVLTSSSPTFAGLTVDGGSIDIEWPVTVGGWARGMNFENETGTERVAGVGLLGSADTVTYLYMAHGLSPWASGTGLYVDTNGDVSIGATTGAATLDVTGDLILQNGVAISEFSTDGTLAGNSDLAVPTEQAVKTYVDAQIGSSGSMSNFTLTGDSGTAQLISQGNTLDIAGGTGISTVVGATDTVTVSITDDSIDGAQLADTITLDSTLAITQGSLDVNFDANTLFIDGSANRVGIGTASPDFGLHVLGGSYVGTNTGASPFVIARSGAGRDVFSEEEVRFTIDDQNYIQEYIQDESNAQFILRLNATASESGTPSFAQLSANSQGVFNWNDDFYVIGTGGVGIGVASPSGALQVNGDEVRIGAGTPGTATGAGDLFVTDALEVDGSIVLGANAITGFSTATALGTSDALLPTQNAVKSYVDTAIAGTGSMNGFTLAGDSGTSPINDSDTLDVAGGTAITTSVSGDTVTVGVTADSIDGAQLADTITLDATLAITQGSLDVNFDANTLVVDGSANRVGIGTAAPSAKLDVVGDIEVSDRINHAGTGVVQEFSNGCTMTANATGLYWTC